MESKVKCSETNEDYAPEKLIEPMAANYYYLQYYIYILAVDTYLKSRLLEYTYERHFGGVFYIFLRGVPGISDKADGSVDISDNSRKSYGVYFDKPDNNVIKRLSRELIYKY